MSANHFFLRPVRQSDRGNRRPTEGHRQQIHAVFTVAKSEDAIEWERRHRDRLAAAEKVVWEQGTMR